MVAGTGQKETRYVSRKMLSRCPLQVIVIENHCGAVTYSYDALGEATETHPISLVDVSISQMLFAGSSTNAMRMATV